MKSKITFQDIVKILIIALVGFLMYRIIDINRVSSQQVEGYTNQLNNNLPNHFGNLIPVKSIKYNNSALNTVTLNLTDTVRLESINLVIDNTESSNQLVQIFTGTVLETDDINNNLLTDEFGNTEHQLINTNRGKVLTINDLYSSSKNKVSDNTITIMLEGGKNFTVSEVKVFGMPVESPNRNIKQLSSLQTFSTNTYTKSSSTDKENPERDIYKYILQNPIDLHVINFNTAINNYNPNNPPKVEIHYQSLNDIVYRVNIDSYLSEGENSIFLPISVIAKKIYLRVPRNHQNDVSITQVSGLSNELFMGTLHNINKFTNVETNADPRMVGKKAINTNESLRGSGKEEFSGMGGYSADDMCPNLSAIEDKLRLTDQICSRLEYNDKIRNERIKLERNKQYILKLKQQDDEIKKLEKVIRSLQDKRENRDAYNDALRLAQFNKQKKQAAVIKDLAEERDRLRKNNVINIQMNLRKTPKQT